MNLKYLSKDELNSRFLDINSRYLNFVRRPFREYANDPEYMKIQKQLHQVMNELHRRRENDKNAGSD